MFSSWVWCFDRICSTLDLFALKFSPVRCDFSRSGKIFSWICSFRIWANENFFCCPKICSKRRTNSSFRSFFFRICSSRSFSSFRKRNSFSRLWICSRRNSRRAVSRSALIENETNVLSNWENRKNYFFIGSDAVRSENLRKSSKTFHFSSIDFSLRSKSFSFCRISFSARSIRSFFDRSSCSSRKTFFIIPIVDILRKRKETIFSRRACSTFISSFHHQSANMVVAPGMLECTLTNVRWSLRTVLARRTELMLIDSETQFFSNLNDRFLLLTESCILSCVINLLWVFKWKLTTESRTCW